MRKCITIILTIVLLLTYSICALAVELGDQTEIIVKAKVEYNIEGEYSANIEDGSATVETDDGTTVTVENAPKGALRLIVVPISTSEREAWSWITACFKDKGMPIHTFDIYFADENGNRINADGALVTIDCPHCTTKPMVFSLTTSGEVKELSNNAHSVSLTFTTDGSHYYVMAKKASASVLDDDHKEDVKDLTDGKVNISDKTQSSSDTETSNVTYKDKSTKAPQTGDNSWIGQWITITLISAAGIGILIFLSRRKMMENEF